MNEYKGFIPPCGIFCGACPNYNRARKPCPGAEIGCPPWRKHGQDLIANQRRLQELGEEACLEMWNSRAEIDSRTRGEG